MAYATKDEILSMFRNLDMSVSNPAITEAEITDFISETEAEINAKIGTLYSMPITGTEALLVLKRLTKYGVACIVDDILNDYSEADKKPTWCKKFNQLMNDIVPPSKDGRQPEPTMKLPDAGYIGTSTQRGRVFISATEGTVFKKNGDNW
jgi:hypothetical protein